MISKGDILDMLLVMGIIALAIGISAGIEYVFCEYII
jgi:hypothetical protein